jgi:hypothetical protein
VADDRVKEEFIIKERPSDDVLVWLGKDLQIPFSVTSEGLQAEKKDDGYVLKSADGADYWQLLEPTIEDATKKIEKITGILDAEKYTLTVSKDYLSNASYPVTIDPTVVINTSSSTAPVSPSTMKSLVRTSDGTLHNFVQIGTQTATCGGSSKSGLLWFISTDSGATWTCQDQLSSDTSNLFYASAVVDSSDNIYVVYSLIVNTRGTTHDVFYRKLTKGAGATWTFGSAQTAIDDVQVGAVPKESE